MRKEDEIKKFLKDRLKESRFVHTLGVRDSAAQLSEKYGENVEKAITAGLLHDCAKNMSDMEIVEIVEHNGYNIDDVCQACPELLHGLAGSIIAEREVGLRDQDILNSIRYHTTGRKKMSLLEKIIYIADYIEPSRNFPGVEELRKLAFKDLEESLILSFDITIKFVIERGRLLHPDTIEARNYLISNKCR